jgi:hypothetical protein
METTNQAEISTEFIAGAVKRMGEKVLRWVKFYCK